MEGQTKKCLIATACNQKYENFLINDWLKSLKENVDLKDIETLAKVGCEIGGMS